MSDDNVVSVARAYQYRLLKLCTTFRDSINAGMEQMAEIRTQLDCHADKGNDEWKESVAFWETTYADMKSKSDLNEIFISSIRESLDLPPEKKK